MSGFNAENDRGLLVRIVVAAVATVLAVGVALHEYQYKQDHPHAYGPAVVVALLALAVALLGAVQVWSLWTQHEKEERERGRARWQANVASFRAEIEQFEKAHPGVEYVPAQVKAQGFIISLGYHGLPRKDLDSVLSEGLLRDRTESHGCQQGGHVALAGTPEIAANFGDVILEVIMDGLEGRSLWYGGENRVHGDIEPSRLRIHPGEVTPNWDGYIDPAKTPLGNFPTCCDPSRLVGFLDADYREMSG